MSRKRAKKDTTLCINFCQYYKPGRNEDLECQGFVVVHGLIKKGRKLSQERPGISAKPDARTLEGLKGRVCTACAFREADCDFILSGGTAAPCGGFSLLAHLLGSRELKLDEIE
ncbi:MAG: Radical domain protein [Nitrospirae bacterium]|nr:Radical domain protein [Nitrospirota bacterium]